MLILYCNQSNVYSFCARLQLLHMALQAPEVLYRDSQSS